MGGQLREVVEARLGDLNMKMTIELGTYCVTKFLRQDRSLTVWDSVSQHFQVLHALV
jgi:hypothetical protein